MKKGFTLIEVLVSITILITTIVIPMSIIARHLIENGITQRGIIARNLAQEGIEHIRYAKDTNILNSTAFDWLGGKETIGTDLRKCIVSPQNNYCVFKDNDSNEAGYVKPLSINIRGEKISKGINIIGFELGGLYPSKDINENSCDKKNTFTPDVEGFNRIFYLEASPKETLPIYADITVCVSWVDKGRNGESNIVRKIELEERIYKWIGAN